MLCMCLTSSISFHGYIPSIVQGRGRATMHVIKYGLLSGTCAFEEVRMEKHGVY